MEGTQVIALAIGIILIIGFIVSEIERVAYNRGVREGYHRGRALSRSEFWSE